MKIQLKSRRGRLPLLVFCFLTAQPVLDVLAYWQQTLGLGNALTLGLRMLLLGGTVLAAWGLASPRRHFWLLAGALLALTLGHVLANLKGGYRAPVTDLVNLLRIYTLPLTTFCLAACLKRDGRVWPALCAGLLADLGLILLVEVLSTLTGTDPHTYANDGIGVLGWFLWTSSQSAILSMLLPVCLCVVCTRWPDRLLPLLLVTAAGEGALFCFGTRLAFAALLAAGLGFGLCLLLADRRRWRQSCAVLLVTLLFAACYPLSPTSARQNANQALTQRNQDRIEAIDEDRRMEWTYRNFLGGMVTRFGLERVEELYDYTTDAAILGNVRTYKLRFCQLLMEEKGGACRLFGLNLSDLRVQYGTETDPETGETRVIESNYDPENDLPGIYYLTGLVGLGGMLAFLLYLGLGALISLLRDPKRRFTPQLAGFALAYCCAMAHILFTASILRRNNASVYLAAVLAALWYLSRPREEAPPESAGGG